MNISPIDLRNAKNKIIKSGQSDLMAIAKNHAENNAFVAADIRNEEHLLKQNEVEALKASSNNSVNDAKLYLSYLYYFISSEAMSHPSTDTTGIMRQYVNTLEFILKNDKKNDNSHLAYLLADFYIEHKVLDDTYQERGEKIMKALLVKNDEHFYSFARQKLNRKKDEVHYDRDHYAYQFINLLMEIIKKTPKEQRPSHLFDDISTELAKHRIYLDQVGYQHTADYAKALADLHTLQSTMLENPKSMLGKIAKGVNLPQSLSQTAESIGKGRSSTSKEIFAALSEINVNSIKKGGIQRLKNVIDQINQTPAARTRHEFK